MNNALHEFSLKNEERAAYIYTRVSSVIQAREGECVMVPYTWYKYSGRTSLRE